MEATVHFIDKAYRRALFPGMLSILGGTINILADGVLVGQRLGTTALAAINLCLPVYLFLCVVGSFVVSGTATQAARAMGKNAVAESAAFYRAAVFGTLTAGAAITVLGLLFLSPVTAFLCSDAALRGMVSDYTGITLLGALPKVLIYVPFWFLRLDGQNKTVTAMMAVMGGLNILLDILFLFVFDFGVAGAAWASVIATAAACGVGMWRLWGKDSGFHLSGGRWPDRRSWLKAAKSGAPAALNNLFQTLRTLCVNLLLLQYGGALMVAVFSALNCVSAFSLCVIDGVPQAASAMLGIYCGEYDHSSIRLLIRRQWKSGAWYTILFSIAAVPAAPLIQKAYGLPEALLLPIACLALSFLPALWNSILISYYNLLERSLLASIMVASRVLIFAVAGLWALLRLSLSPWWFFACGECFTLLLWLALSGLVSGRHKNLSRFLLLDDVLEREGRVMNFSVRGTAPAICEASEKITEFCENNRMEAKQIMRFCLSIEEILTVIMQKNPGELIDFDIKAFSLQGVMGIRIRYGGVPCNPIRIEASEEDADFCLGIRMIEKMAEEIVYQSTFGTNSLQIFV